MVTILSSRILAECIEEGIAQTSVAGKGFVQARNQSPSSDASSRSTSTYMESTRAGYVKNTHGDKKSNIEMA